MSTKNQMNAAVLDAPNGLFRVAETQGPSRARARCWFVSKPAASTRSISRFMRGKHRTHGKRFRPCSGSISPESSKPQALG